MFLSFISCEYAFCKSVGTHNLFYASATHLHIYESLLRLLPQQYFKKKFVKNGAVSLVQSKLSIIFQNISFFILFVVFFFKLDGTICRIFNHIHLISSVLWYKLPELRWILINLCRGISVKFLTWICCISSIYQFLLSSDCYLMILKFSHYLIQFAYGAA